MRHKTWSTLIQVMARRLFNTIAELLSFESQGTNLGVSEQNTFNMILENYICKMYNF